MGCSPKLKKKQNKKPLNVQSDNDQWGWDLEIYKWKNKK